MREWAVNCAKEGHTSLWTCVKKCPYSYSKKRTAELCNRRMTWERGEFGMSSICPVYILVFHIFVFFRVAKIGHLFPCTDQACLSSAVAMTGRGESEVAKGGEGWMGEGIGCLIFSPLLYNVFHFCFKCGKQIVCLLCHSPICLIFEVYLIHSLSLSLPLYLSLFLSIYLSFSLRASELKWEGKLPHFMRGAKAARCWGYNAPRYHKRCERRWHGNVKYARKFLPGCSMMLCRKDVLKTIICKNAKQLCSCQNMVKI